MKRLIIQIGVFLLLAGAFFPIEANPFKYNNLEILPEALPVVNPNEDTIRSEIETQAKHWNEKPDNAKIDKVWKKMPGRNGLKVNVEESVAKMKKAGKFDQSLLVVEQVQPRITFEDLPAAPVYRGHPEKKMVTLLVNVAWGSENIPSMLKTLREKNVKANFFIEGKWASQNAELVKMIKEEGHTIGNHAYNHPDMKRLTADENREQIEQTNEIIKAITGDTPKWFAPPSGSFNEQVVQIAAELDMETVLWSVDTVDWKKPTVPVMVKRVEEKVHPGAMVLMHPTDVVNSGLDELIEMIKRKGYKIAAIERLLSEQR
ncbi:polysaccharide deacetylase family protein [Sediminibacillus halophilus]|uniref:Probable sporulation protein, polysaccharide deacetylase family n=1 Tax=Sediminibacillus halophilus TaxID=482461 RepID=A0A1G9MEN7_9BACI|nr:polysaccharide deacetylase family protein [Sediminibacillus halophilus]SDL72720.1 probable sporulation protein, polysaccharide deacetylase family [Sediminibacillus halophilus]